MSLFDSAEYAASLSICNKRKVGAALSVNGEVVAIGFNHGDTELCSCSHEHENPNVIHAEIMALHDFKFLHNDYVELAVNYPPCLNCANEIVKRGVSRVYYTNHRNDKTSGLEFLKLNKVEVLREWKI